MKIQHVQQREIINESIENNDIDINNVNNDINNPVPQEQHKIEVSNMVNAVQNITNNNPVKEQLKTLFQQNYQPYHSRGVN